MNSKAILAAFVGAVLVSQTARAVVPSGRTIIRRLAEKQALDRVTAAPLTGAATIPGRPAQLPARLDVTLPASCKAQVDGAEGQFTLSYALGKLTHQGPQNVAFEALLALSCPLVALKNQPASEAEASVEKLLASWGVEIGTSSLGLLDGRPAYVIGAKPRELSKPQVWVDKVTDRVIRIIGSYGGRLWDIRYEDPASVATNRIAPRVTQVWQNKSLELTLHLMASEPKVNSAATVPEESGDD